MLQVGTFSSIRHIWVIRQICPDVPHRAAMLSIPWLLFGSGGLYRFPTHVISWIFILTVEKSVFLDTDFVWKWDLTFSSLPNPFLFIILFNSKKMGEKRGSRFKNPNIFQIYFEKATLSQSGNRGTLHIPFPIDNGLELGLTSGITYWNEMFYRFHFCKCLIYKIRHGHTTLLFIGHIPSSAHQPISFTSAPKM